MNICSIKTRLNKGFTLAEVLITLAIIGVVAAMTIPALIQSVNKQQYVSKLQKEYSVLSQAYNKIKSDNGGSILGNPNFDCSGTCNLGVSANAMNEFAQYLNVSKNCGIDTGCWHSSPIKYLGGTAIYGLASGIDLTWAEARGKAILADGTMIMVKTSGNSCKSNMGSGPLANAVCGYIQIDVNGATGPNIYGRDFFGFWIAQTGLYPMGSLEDGASCDISSAVEFTSSGCTAKVIQEGAMNY